jgi:DNA helicase-2/ATP-dependent DNA helicase PcrA
MDPILHGLNHAQREAVTSSGSVLQVLAPPGSGKTKTLTARVAYLLSHYGYQPQDVICCTFTIKASREMRERLAKLIGEKLESRLILGTFHSICRRYLVKYGYLIGLRKGFGIADSDDTRAIIRVCLVVFVWGLALSNCLQRTIKRLKSSIEVKAAQGRISRHKAHGISADALAEGAKAEEMELVDIYRDYESALAASNLLDYDDLLLRCSDLLREHPQCVSNVQAVLVDEFQDTNIIQYELMNLFASQNRRITVVGDPDQSIYGFRSAEIKNLKRMQGRYSNTTVALLEDNYRSAGSILNAAQEVIEQDTSRPAKALQATHSFGTLPVLRRLPTPNAEAQWIVLEIKRCAAMTGGLLRMSDFAVLLRSASLSTQIETAFGRAGIPYKMVGGRKFFDRTEVKILLNYMRVASHTGHSDALLNIINVPPRRIGDETIKQLTSGAEKAKLPLWDFIKDVIQGRRSTEKKLQKAAEQGLCNLVQLIEASRQKLQECEDASAPRVLIEFITERLSFQEYLIRAYPLDEDSRWANVKELMHQATEAAAFEEEEVDKEMDLPEIEGVQQQQAHAGEESLTRFLANVALATEITTQEENKEGDQPTEKVTISTIHAAKGLEWPVVFVPAVYNGSIPHSRAEVIEEERRLLYVAMTRAQALLYLSVPTRQPRLGEGEDGATTLTQFLPPKLTKSRFRQTGPALHEKVVYAIADILRRPRPLLEDMYKGLEFLPSTLDDRWTAEGEEDRSKMDDTSASHDGTDEPNPKRRRSDMNQGPKTTTYVSSTGYTMNNSTGFTIPTTVSAGFTSARDYVAANPQPIEDSAAKSASTPNLPADATRANKPNSLSAGRKDGLTQASISNFFTGPGSQKKEATLPNRPRASGKYELPSQNQRPQAANVPQPLSSHRVQPRPLIPTRPTLEPTNPNGYTWMAAPSKPPGPKPRMTMTQEQGVSNAASSGSETKPETKPEPSGFQTATTFHTTTMSMVQQGPRRALGMRRSMTGWQDRMKRDSGGRG